MNSRDPRIPPGRSTGFARKNSRPAAFLVWSSMSTESVMWKSRNFLCSPAQVNLLGVKGPSLRSLLYVSGLSQVGLFPFWKGLIRALNLNFSLYLALCWSVSIGSVMVVR